MNRTEEICSDGKKCTFELTDRSFREDFNRKVDELLNFQYNIITKLDDVLARLTKLVA